MGRIQYFAIQQAIQDILKADDNLKDDMIVVEEEPPTNTDYGRYIGIYLERRDAVPGSIAAGTRQRFSIQFVIWCFGVHMESVAQAAEIRDILMSQVEVALLRGSKSLNNTVQRFVLAGGEFDSARIEGGLMMGGSILLNAEAEATI